MPLLVFFLISLSLSFFFFFNDTATTEIYTLSLHDALPIYCGSRRAIRPNQWTDARSRRGDHVRRGGQDPGRSGEHTAELQSQSKLVLRLLLEKKKKKKFYFYTLTYKIDR